MFRISSGTNKKQQLAFNYQNEKIISQFYQKLNSKHIFEKGKTFMTQSSLNNQIQEQYQKKLQQSTQQEQFIQINGDRTNSEDQHQIQTSIEQYVPFDNQVSKSKMTSLLINQQKIDIDYVQTKNNSPISFIQLDPYVNELKIPLQFQYRNSINIQVTDKQIYTQKENQNLKKFEIDLKQAAYQGKSSLYSWFVLIIILLLRIIHQNQQQGFAYMYGFKGEGLQAGNPFYEISSFFPSLPSMYGLFTGPAFSLSYAVAGIFMGILVEKYNRQQILSWAAILWSLTSLFSGFTNSIFVLFAMRFILGLLVSATEPIGLSLIGDYFPRKIRTTANSVFGTGGYLGSASSVLFVFITKHFGWRWTYILSGGFGIFIGIISLFFVKEPKKGLQNQFEFQQLQFVNETEKQRFIESQDTEIKKSQQEIEQKSLWVKFSSSLIDIMSHPVGKWCTLAAMFRYLGIMACDYWGPYFFLRYYPEHASKFLTIFPFLILTCGFSSALLGGVISDRFGQGKPMMKAMVCFIGNLIAFPMMITALTLRNNFWLSISLIGGRLLFGECWKSPNITMVQETVDPKKFGSFVSAYQFYQIVTGCFSTFMVGQIVNSLNGANNPRIIGDLLALFCTIGYSGAIFSFWMAGRHYTAIKTNAKFSFY